MNHLKVAGVWPGLPACQPLWRATTTLPPGSTGQTTDLRGSTCGWRRGSCPEEQSPCCLDLPKEWSSTALSRRQRVRTATISRVEDGPALSSPPTTMGSWNAQQRVVLTSSKPALAGSPAIELDWKDAQQDLEGLSVLGHSWSAHDCHYFSKLQEEYFRSFFLRTLLETGSQVELGWLKAFLQRGAPLKGPCPHLCEPWALRGRFSELQALAWDVRRWLEDLHVKSSLEG